MLSTRWNLKKSTKKIPSVQIDEDVLSILSARGIVKKADIDNFIHPKLENITDPKKLEDMEKATSRIMQAIQNDEKIFIYGDYDVDGITSTSILYLGLKNLGAKYLDYYIPIRDEGYGLNKEALKYIKDQNCDLVITVDCGITSYKEIEYSNSLNLDVIITDHHNLLKKEVPNAFAVINPKRYENEFGFRELAGVGVAFMLLLNLYDKYGKKDEAYSYIDLVAIGTIADVVPLICENRIIVKYGLEKLLNTENKGLAKLCYKLFGQKLEYNTGDVSFSISPVFNAAGRMQDAKLVVKLLTSENEREIDIIIQDLISKNFQRKEIQNEIFEMSKKDIKPDEDYILISSSPKYHHGVIGIVAAKIVDLYYKPVIIMEEKIDEGIAVASCRSIANFDITKALQSVAIYLEKFGGHTGAAGFTIKIENIEKFKKAINEYAKKTLKEEDFCKIIDIDKPIPIQKMSYEFYKTIELLKPFGFGNPMPVFLTKNLIIENLKLIGDDKKHISFDIAQKGYEIKSVCWFNKADEFLNLKSNIFYDIVYKINLSQFRGRTYTKIYVEDMKPSLLEEDKFSYLRSIYKTKFPMKSIFYSKQKIDLDTKLELDFSNYLAYINKFGRQIGVLDNNISRLLITLANLYNFKYEIKLLSSYEVEGLYNNEIIIQRNYDFKTFKRNDKNLFNQIKKHLIQDLEYDNFTKSCLSALFINNKNINIVCDKKERLINLLLTVSIFNCKYNDKKVYFKTKDKQFLNNMYLKNFVSFKDNDSNYLITDDKIDKLDLSKYEKIIIISEQNLKLENFETMENNIEIPSNVYKLTKENIEKYGIENIYTYYLPNDEKKKIKEKLIENEIILADESIFEIL